MAGEETPDVEPERDAEKPSRRRARPAADAAASETPAEKPKRTRSRAAKPAAQEAAGQEEAPKPRRTRAAKPAAQEAAAQDEAPKPRRTRAAKPATAETVAAADEDAPKPRRTRGAKPAESAAEEAAPAPARSRRPVEAPLGSLLRRPRRRTQPAGAPPVVYATARYVRSSPRKARLVCDHIRGKSVTEARAILAFAPRSVARDWSKLLESAVANAEHNHELIGDELRIKAVYADAGPTIKRFTPRAQGRATPILKRTSHLSIALTPKE
jgi:ribosomal protein L22